MLNLDRGWYTPTAEPTVETLKSELLATRENVGLALDLLEQAIFPQDMERAIELLRAIAAEL